MTAISLCEDLDNLFNFPAFKKQDRAQGMSSYSTPAVSCPSGPVDGLWHCVWKKFDTMRTDGVNRTTWFISIDVNDASHAALARIQLAREAAALKQADAQRLGVSIDTQVLYSKMDEKDDPKRPRRFDEITGLKIKFDERKIAEDENGNPKIRLAKRDGTGKIEKWWPITYEQFRERQSIWFNPNFTPAFAVKKELTCPVEFSVMYVDKASGGGNGGADLVQEGMDLEGLGTSEPAPTWEDPDEEGISDTEREERRKRARTESD
jgi:hypothetical protein